MPYVVIPPQLRNAAAAILAIALFSCAAPAVASASQSSACASSSTSTPFAQFGDTASYALLAGGSFESGAPGWLLQNAEVVSGGVSLGATRGSHSLAIQPSGVAVSPSFCINTEEPSFRFFLRQTSGSWAVLNVILVWTDSSGTVHDTTVGSLQTGTSWAASPVLQLATTLPLSSSGTISAKLEFKPEPYGGAWAIDDVYIDPHSR